VVVVGTQTPFLQWVPDGHSGTTPSGECGGVGGKRRGGERGGEM
jgi:hypothetical protein